MKKTTFTFLRPSVICVCSLVVVSFTACDSNRTETVNEAINEENTAVVTEADNTAANEIESTQFQTDFTAGNRYESWDTNRDNYLDENEYSESFFGVLDTDRDGTLNEQEWDKGSSTFAGNNKDRWSRDAWDTNTDKAIDREEFRTGMGTTNYYRDWDMDKNNQLTRQEYIDGVVKLWDIDSNGFLDRSWYRENYDLYYGNNS